MRRLRAAIALGAAAASLVAGAAPAHADSLVYTRDGDVWLAYPDGSGQTRLTHAQRFREATQADDGTIVATTADRTFARLDRAGTVLAEFPAPSLENANWSGPWDPDLSPDGTKVAYTWMYGHVQDLPGCPLAPAECAARWTRGGAAVSWATRATPLNALGWWRYWTTPSWIGNDRVLLGGRYLTAARAGIGTLGSDGGYDIGWYGGDLWLGDGELTRQSDRVAWVTGAGAEELSVWASGVTLPAGTPRLCFAFTRPSGAFADPTWAPDGQTLAWSEDDGIWVSPVPGCSQTGVAARLLIPGADHPDWGPADIPGVAPPVRRTPPDERGPDQRVPEERPPVERRAPSPRRAVVKRCVVPKVKAGATVAAAKKALSRGGCGAKTKQVRSAKVRKGRVVKLGQKAGRRLKAGTVVVVEVSRGRR